MLRAEERPAFPTADARLGLYDLFSGAGGLTAGFLLAGLETGVELGARLAIEREQAAARVYTKNIGLVVNTGDIDDLIDGAAGASLSANERKLQKAVGEVQIGLAGPPCQGHSDLNNHTRRDDPRNALYARVARAAAVLEPRVLCVENVPAVRNDHERVLETTVAELERLGYLVADAFIDMLLIGVPQRRR